MALTQEQIKNRRIGGSSINVVMGLSKYKTRFQLWQEMTGQIEIEDISNNTHIICGNKLEPAIRAVQIERGYEIKELEEQITIDKYPFYSGFVDGYSGDTVEEIKTVLNWRKDFGPDGSSEVPIDYNSQLNWYMLNKRFKNARLHACFMPLEVKELIANVELSDKQLIDIVRGLEMRVYNVEPDFILQEQMLEMAEYFWDCVQNVTPPALLTAEEVTQRYLNSSDDTIPATDDILRQDSQLRSVKEEIKVLTAEAKALQNNICVHMGEHGTLIYGDKKIRSYKTQETRRLDTKRIKEAGLYDEYSNVSATRVFR